jgi:hypothetical protein
LKQYHALQDLRCAEDPRKLLPFGGVTVCFCGDFRQILPVVKMGTRGQIVDAYAEERLFLAYGEHAEAGRKHAVTAGRDQ